MTENLNEALQNRASTNNRLPANRTEQAQTVSIADAVQGTSVQWHGRVMRRPDVLEATGLSTSTIYEMMAAGEFPKPIRLGKRAVGWPESVIREWLETRQQVA